MAFRFVLIPGQAVSSRRAIGFLDSDTDASFDGRRKFEELEPARDREVRTRFDYWISEGKNNRWFHGFEDEPKYRRCFASSGERIGNTSDFMVSYIIHSQIRGPDFSFASLSITTLKMRT